MLFKITFIVVLATVRRVKDDYQRWDITTKPKTMRDALYMAESYENLFNLAI